MMQSSIEKKAEGHLETALTRPAMAEPAPDERADAHLLVRDFDRVVRAHQRRIYRILLGILRDGDAADTLTQECFLRAWQKRAGFRGEASVSTWLTRIAVNLAIDHQRNRRAAFWKRLFASQARTEEESAAELTAVPDGGASPERQLLAREQAGRVWALAAELPVQQRAVFVLRFAEELSLEEIAAAMNVQVGTVKAHLFRAVQVIRQRIGSREK